MRLPSDSCRFCSSIQNGGLYPVPRNSTRISTCPFSLISNFVVPILADCFVRRSNASFHRSGSPGLTTDRLIYLQIIQFLHYDQKRRSQWRFRFCLNQWAAERGHKRWWSHNGGPCTSLHFLGSNHSDSARWPNELCSRLVDRSLVDRRG